MTYLNQLGSGITTDIKKVEAFLTITRLEQKKGVISLFATLVIYLPVVVCFDKRYLHLVSEAGKGARLSVSRH